MPWEVAKHKLVEVKVSIHKQEQLVIQKVK